MILVLRAIASTDVTLPVPQRMSVGLRAVGVEMTVLLAVEEVMALGLLWWVEISVRPPLSHMHMLETRSLTSAVSPRRSCASGSASARSCSSSTTSSSSRSSRRSSRSIFSVSRCVPPLSEPAHKGPARADAPPHGPLAARRPPRPEPGGAVPARPADRDGEQVGHGDVADLELVPPRGELGVEGPAATPGQDGDRRVLVVHQRHPLGLVRPFHVICATCAR